MGGEIGKIKHLRERTGLSFAEIKKALQKSGGDEDEAVKILKARGVTIAEKKSSREAKEGIIEAYIHNNFKVGSLLELNCETDFVAKNLEFKNLARELAMQITSMNPESVDDLLGQAYIRDQDITIEELIQQYIAKLGENIRVGKFERLEI